MNTFLLTVATPDGNVFEGECLMLSVRGTEGELAVMAGHAPFVTSLVKGACKITLPDESEKRAFIEGGILSVTKDGATMVAGTFRFEE